MATLGCSVRARVRGSAESRAALPGLSRRRGLASTDNRWPRPESSEGPRHRQSRLASPGSHYTMEVSSPSLITHNSLTSARLEAGSRGPQLLQFYIASDNFCNIRARGCNILGPGSAGICVAAWAPLWPQCCSGAGCAQVDTGLCPSDGLPRLGSALAQPRFALCYKWSSAQSRVTWRGEAGRGEDVAGAGTMTVVQTVAEAHMWPLARDRGAWPDVQTLAEAPAWPHVAEVRGQLGLAWSHGLLRRTRGGARHKAGPG